MTYLRGIRMDRGATLAASDSNGSFATAGEKASMFNDVIKDAYAALVFNEAGFTTANKASVFNEAGFTAANKALVFNEAGFTTANKAGVCNEASFTFANKALMFREAGLSIANINAIIIHANISDDNAQQILSEITKANRDLTSAANIYEMLDDWNDNKVCVARDGAGTASTGFTNLFAHKNLFRPQWTQVSGTTAAAGGEMVFNEVSECVKIASTFNVGTWELTVTITVTGNNKYLMFYPIYVDATHYYKVVIGQSHLGAAAFYLQTKNGGDESTIISGTWDNDNAEHAFKITRDASGNFEIFQDGVSKGAVLDNNITTNAELRLFDEGGSNAEFNLLKVW